ncbi:hypothetical protein L6R52_02685 [Myxococcota bacterium]|nr:hypothetical protein [Myxococcota bacterium]
MALHRTPLAALLGLCAGPIACSGAVDDLRFAFDHTGTLVTIAAPAGGAPDVRAFDVAEAEGYLAIPRPAAGTRLFAAWNDCRIDALGLDEGPLAITDDGAPLPTHTRSFELDAEDRWVMIEALPPPIDALEIERRVPSPCAEIEVRSRATFAAEGASIRVLLGDPTSPEVFAATSSGAFYAIGPDGIRTLPLPRSTPRAGGFRDARGRTWLVGLRGQLVVGTPDAGFEPSTPIPFLSARQRVWLTGSPEGDELFVMDDRGAIGHFVDGAWGQLRVADVPADGRPFTRGGAVWQRPGEAQFVGPTYAVLTFRDRVLSEEVLSETPTAIALVPGFGPLVGGTRGTIWAERDSAWNGLGTPLAPSALRVILDVDRGFVTGGVAGRFVEWQPGWGFCEPVTLTDLVVPLAARIAGGYALFSFAEDRTAPSIEVTFVDVTPPPLAECARLGVPPPGW